MRAVLFWIFLVWAGVCHAGWIDADDTSIQYVGRISFVQPKAPAFSWTGVSIQFRFTGPLVAVRIQDGFNRYTVEIDGSDRGVLVTRPDQIEYTLANGLGEGVHQLRLTKRHESHYSIAKFLGVRVADGHRLLPSPARNAKRIEVVGDSYVACYGCEASGREGYEKSYLQYTNITKSFGALLARHYDAEGMLLAYSGKGLVRNAAGDSSGATFPVYYERTLHAGENIGSPQERWFPSRWVPGLVVIHLGINDFGGQASIPALPHEFVARYEQFLNNLRSRYPGAKFVLMSVNEWPYGLLRPAVERVVQKQNNAGHHDLFHFHYDMVGEALDWHPSVRQHREIADALISVIDREGLMR